MENSKPERPEFPTVVDTSYKASVDHIRFMKQQQWMISNYLVLILAGIFGVAKAFSPLSTCERIIGTSFAVLALGCGWALLILIQIDLGKTRQQVERVAQDHMNEREREILKLRPYAAPFMRGSLFLGALMGVSVMVMSVVIYSLWRS
jgi:hypothetical protein